MALLLREFEKYPTEKAIIGELLTCYGEIEFATLACLRHMLGFNASTAARILFRVRGESARIEVADAILRPEFKKLNLDGKWGNAVGAMRVCKSIRNQYAHCYWIQGDKPTFCNLDIDTQSTEGEVEVQTLTVDLELLQAQRKYFEYTLDCLYYLERQGQKHSGYAPSRRSPDKEEWPKSIAAPRLHIREA